MLDVPLYVEPETVMVEFIKAENVAYAHDGLDGVRQLTKDTTPAADDTGRNARDRDDQTLTPMDQSNDPRDLKLTRDIRRALTADKKLSTTAKNIKIITAGGKVTLRGPVTSTKERAKIVKKAKAIAKGPVDNQLEVITK
jgi:osmotically-inducible protein OsmY